MTKQQKNEIDKAVAEIKRLINITGEKSTCGVFKGGHIEIDTSIRDSLANNMHNYLNTWVGIELLKIEAAAENKFDHQGTLIWG